MKRKKCEAEIVREVEGDDVRMTVAVVVSEDREDRK